MPTINKNTIEFEVTFGPKTRSERESKIFTTEEGAATFFRKEALGMYVDVYKIETNVVERRTKLTNPEK